MKNNNLENSEELVKFNLSLPSYTDKLDRAKDFTERVNLLAEMIGGATSFSRATGISISGINRYLKGGEPTIGQLTKIASGFDLNLKWLVLGEFPIKDEPSYTNKEEKPNIVATSKPEEINERQFFHIIQGFNENQEALSTTKLEDQIGEVIKTYNLLQRLPEQQHEDTIKLHAVRLDIKHMEIHKDMTEGLLTSNPETAETLKPLIKDIEDRLESLKNKAAILVDRIQQ